mmetsp:Transcript_37757/g.94742  ORF Transcript_37757/g.94742 Transcript_37757/m.94742 type:complete len:208 (+) Transcript_37757:2515-3138(+)
MPVLVGAVEARGQGDLHHLVLFEDPVLVLVPQPEKLSLEGLSTLSCRHERPCAAARAAAGSLDALGGEVRVQHVVLGDARLREDLPELLIREVAAIIGLVVQQRHHRLAREAFFRGAALLLAHLRVLGRPLLLAAVEARRPREHQQLVFLQRAVAVLVPQLEEPPLQQGPVVRPRLLGGATLVLICIQPAALRGLRLPRPRETELRV